MVARTDPNLTDQLAAMIVAHYEIPREIAKTMSNREIVAMLEWDHDPVPVAIARDLGWGRAQYNHATNLTGRFPEVHKIKSATQDVPQIAKAERISKANLEFQRRALAKSGQGEAPDRPRSKWARGRKLQSRPFRKLEKA